MRRFVLLTLTVVCCVSAVRQSFQQQHQQHKAEFQEPSRQPSSENTAHGVWKPKRSAWLNDSPPTERMIGDFQGIEPIPKASIKGRYQSDELQNSLQSYDGTKRVVKHITSLEPSGYEGGNEGNNLEAWQSMQSSNHGGVFPDGYDGLSAIPRTVNNEVAPSSMRAPFRRPSRPQPPRIANLPAKTYSRIPPPSSRRHVPEMRQPSFVPPDRILSSSPLSGDFDLPMPPLDRFQRGSGDLGVATVTVEQTLTMTTQNETTIATTTMETNDTTTTAEVTRTSSLIVPSTTPNSPPDSSNENENAEIVSTTEKNEGSPHFSVKIPDAPPVFENILTASSEETDDDSLEDSHLSTVSKLPNGSSAKRSASYATQLAVDNVAEESRNAKLKCVPCTPGAAPVPPKEEHLPPLEPLPSVDGPYQIPKTLPVSPGETNERPSTSFPSSSSSPSPTSAPIALPASPSITSAPRAPPSKELVSTSLPAKPSAPSYPISDKEPTPAPKATSQPSLTSEITVTVPVPDELTPAPYAPAQPSEPTQKASPAPESSPSETENISTAQTTPPPPVTLIKAAPSNSKDPNPIDPIPVPSENVVSTPAAPVPAQSSQIVPEPVQPSVYETSTANIISTTQPKSVSKLPPGLQEKPTPKQIGETSVAPAGPEPGASGPAPQSPSSGLDPTGSVPSSYVQEVTVGSILPGPDVPVTTTLPPSKPSLVGEEDSGREEDISQEEVNPSERRPELSSISMENSIENISKPEITAVEQPKPSHSPSVEPVTDALPSAPTSSASSSPAPLVSSTPYVSAPSTTQTNAVQVTLSPTESGSEEGSYASFGPPQPAVEENVKETTIPASIPETTAAPAPAPAQTTQPEPEPQPVEHMYEISTPAAALPLAPAPAPQPQPAEHTYGAQGPDIAPVVTATQAPVAPSNPEPLPPNPSQGVAVAPEPTHASIEEAEHAAETPSFPGQASYNNLEEDHDGGDVADLTVPDPVPSPAPESSSPVPGESNYANLEEDHEGEIHEIEETNPAPNVPSIPTPSTGESSYSTFEEETEDTHSGGSSYSSVDVSAEVDIRKGQGKDDEEYEMETENTGDESGEIISNIDEEQIPEVVVPTKPSGGSRSGTMVDNTAPQPNAYQSPQPIKVQVNPATVPYRPRPSPAPRIQPPRPYNPPQVQPQPVPFFQQQLSLPYQVQQPRYSVPMPYLPPNPAPFMPYQPIPQRPPPAGCCGGQLFSRQGGLCMPISFNPCQQQNSCGNSCGGGCGQPQQTSCCTQQVQPCCPQPAPQSCCCPPQPSICRHKRSLGYSLGMCQRRRF